MTHWLDILAHNQFLSGGAVLVVLGGILASLRHLPRRISSAVERLFLVRVEIQDTDEAFQWMQLWLARRLSGTRSVCVLTRRDRQTGEDDEDTAPAVDRPEIHLIPSPGTYAFFFKRRLVLLHRQRDDERPELTGGVTLGRVKESLRLRIFSRNRALAREIVEECRAAALPSDGRIDVRAAPHGYWELVGRQRPRSLQSVIMADRIAERLLADIREFQGEASWYAELGIPYRRGYLLYGPPGNGKTSLVMAIASELGMSVYVLNLANPSLDDIKLMGLLMQVGSNSIVLIEDIDCSHAKRRTSGKNAQLTDKLTFSGLLNAIDGILAQDGRIIFMTTNHREKLDPALIRPGRADVQMEISNAGAEQARRLFARFYPQSHPEFALLFADAVARGSFCMAALQGHLLAHKRDPEAAVHTLCAKSYTPGYAPVERVGVLAARKHATI